MGDAHVHDLRKILNSLNRRYFKGAKIIAEIRWFGRATGRVRKQFAMAMYDFEDAVIWVHRALDREWVPRFFVEWVVYHEMLHQKHGIKGDGHGTRHHFHSFRVDEMRFRHHGLAFHWELRNINRLTRF
jgi:hypothetical protein